MTTTFAEPAYGLTRYVSDTDIEALEARVTEALKTEGFGVLTRIDVRATMQKKLGVEHPPYVILGACNPPLALRALTAEPGIGLLLPCNVVLAQQPDGSHAVSAINPDKLLGMVGRDDLAPFAEEVRARLIRALQAVAGIAA